MSSDDRGNDIEFVIDSEPYVTQPFLIPLDLSRSDAEIVPPATRRARQ